MSHFLHFISHWYHWLSIGTLAPSKIWLTVALGIGILTAVTPITWLWTRLFATYIHETGHALFAIFTGRKVKSMKINQDSSGSTLHAGLEGAVFSRFLTALAGYPGPALAGWVMMVAIANQHARYALGAFIVVVMGLALIQHSLRGWLVTIVILSVCWGLTLVNSYWMQMGITLVAGYLLAASPRTIVELRKFDRQSKKHQVEQPGVHSDAQALAQMTGIGVLFWELIFLGSCLSLFYFTLTSIGIL